MHASIGSACANRIHRTPVDLAKGSLKTALD
jgi:hypothetical protein